MLLHQIHCFGGEVFVLVLATFRSIVFPVVSHPESSHCISVIACVYAVA